MKYLAAYDSIEQWTTVYVPEGCAWRPIVRATHENGTPEFCTLLTRLCGLGRGGQPGMCVIDCPEADEIVEQLRTMKELAVRYTDVTVFQNVDIDEEYDPWYLGYYVGPKWHTVPLEAATADEAVVEAAATLKIGTMQVKVV